MAGKFTAEARGALVERFAAGCTIPDAAAAVGISEKTIKHWLTRGRQEQVGEYADFARRVDEARSLAKDLPGQMDEPEFRQHLETAVRKGNTQAMKLWADLYVDPPPEADEPVDPLAKFDAVASRRVAAPV